MTRERRSLGWVGSKGTYAAPAFRMAKQADDESLRPSHRNANQCVRFHAETLQMPGKAIGTFVQFAITQLTVFCDNGNCVRSPGNLLVELVSNGAIARIIDFGSIPLKQLNG